MSETWWCASWRLSINEHWIHKGAKNIRRLMKIWFPHGLQFQHWICIYTYKCIWNHHHQHHRHVFSFLEKVLAHVEKRKSHINFARSINLNSPSCSFEHGNYDEENWDWECMYVLYGWHKKIWIERELNVEKKVHYNGINELFKNTSSLDDS